MSKFIAYYITCRLVSRVGSGHLEHSEPVRLKALCLRRTKMQTLILGLWVSLLATRFSMPRPGESLQGSRFFCLPEERASASRSKRCAGR